MDTEQIQKTDVQQQNEKINAATFTPNLGTVSCSGIGLPSIKGLVHMFFFKSFLLDILPLCKCKHAPERATLESGFIYLRAYFVTSLGSASLIDYTVIFNKQQQRRPNKFGRPKILSSSLRAERVHSIKGLNWTV